MKYKPRPYYRTKIEESMARIQEEEDRKAFEAYASELFQPMFVLGAPPKSSLEWIVEGLLPRGYLALLAGYPKAGKSSFATAIALAVATGTKFAGRKTQQSPVLWLSLEENTDERKEILKFTPEELCGMMSGCGPSPCPRPEVTVDADSMRGRERACELANRGEGGEPKASATISQIPILTTHTHIPIDTDPGIELLEWWIDQTEAALIVVDPLHGGHSGRSLSDGWAARKTLSKLKDLCTHRRVAALVLHHLGRSEGELKVAESQQLSATASTFWIMERIPGTPSPIPGTPSPISSRGQARSEPDLASREIGEGAGGEVSAAFKITCQGRGTWAHQTLHFRSNNPLHYEPYDPTEPPKLYPGDQKVLDLLANQKLTSKEIIASLPDYKPESIRNAIARLRKANLIDRSPKTPEHRYSQKKSRPEHAC